MGFTDHINGKMIKTMFSHAYKFMIHCVVHALSHRKGAYDETSDYIMNIITCWVLNRTYNMSKVIFEYLKENIRAETNAKGMICRISKPAYVAPENDKRRHENSDSDNEDEKMSQMIEKKTRWWFVRDGKRKRTPETSPVVPMEPTLKIVVKGPSKEPQQRLVDEQVLDPSSIPQEGIDLAKVTFEQFVQLNEAAVATQKDQSSSVQAESVKATEPEGVVQDDSSEADSESTETESELDPTTLGRGKAKLKKKATKKQKGSDEKDSTYTPSVDEPKKQRAKRKAVQTRVIPRSVRAKKTGATLPKDKDGKKEKHVTTS
ncbi:hypothetical protein HanXRQr2_Chr01g0024661 [Helianthus annuus]|uniref:Uncharacterized protein n=1 Tax=Helianthus annuus TaxID=4232 RepID=A0A9K3JW99_HELAN|nr:hypothetical protein HanXRQr2_Chr01g0024661 [Helianthus annuus]KAJ0627150.1 hypothetical protein HanHA89_Chr01g0021981 [Helianthus annuus]KAJ0783464.1 hypothetical protein HanLR1_Chr01g0020591 [Helianthus annuus]